MSRSLLPQDLALEHEKAPTESDVRPWSCIIFCKRKFTVLALNWLLSNCKPLDFLRCAAIMGSGGREGAMPSMLKVRVGLYD